MVGVGPNLSISRILKLVAKTPDSCRTNAGFSILHMNDAYQQGT